MVCGVRPKVNPHDQLATDMCDIRTADLIELPAVAKLTVFETVHTHGTQNDVEGQPLLSRCRACICRAGVLPLWDCYRCAMRIPLRPGLIVLSLLLSAPLSAQDATRFISLVEQKQ